MRNNMSSYTFAIEENYKQIISTHYKFFENDKIEEATLLIATNKSLDLFDYHLEKCGLRSFKKFEHTQIHT